MLNLAPSVDREDPITACWTCGCEREAFLCAEARELWAATSAAFAAGLAGGDFTPYRIACQAFDAHFAQQAPPGDIF